MSSQQASSSSSSSSNAVGKKVIVLNENFKRITYDPIHEYREALKQQQEQIAKNPMLAGNVNFLPLNAHGDQKASVRASQRLHNRVKPPEAGKERPCNEEVNYNRRRTIVNYEVNKYKEMLKTPIVRTSLTDNITMDPNDVIPVFCDYKVEYEEDLELLDDFDSLKFTYVNSNKLEMGTSQQDNHLKLADDHLITCDCTPNPQGITECGQNCKCRKINNLIQSFDGTRTKFDAFQRKYADTGYYGHQAIFACSELCCCKGKCKNNIMMTVNEKLHKLEVTRNSCMGFVARTKTFIPAGVPIVEITGELMSKEVFAARSGSYTMTMNGNLLANKLVGHWELSKIIGQKIPDELKNVWSSDWSIETTNYGNVARFVPHSCDANIVQIKVFQNGFFPTQCRLVFFSIRDIFPGQMLTISYGEEYIAAYLKKVCLCESLGCSYRRTTKKVIQYIPARFSKELYGRIGYRMFKNWEDHVYKPVMNETVEETKERTKQ